MTRPTRPQVMAAFEDIRRAPGQAGSYAPHKPLMLLLALARVQQHLPRLAPFASVEPTLSELLTEFGPTGAAKRRHLPFWHLGTDQQGALWQFNGPPELTQRPAGATPSLGELRQEGVSAGLAQPIHDALVRDPALLREVAQRLLDASFPETLHADIATAVGLDLNGAMHRADEPTPAFVPTSSAAACAVSTCAWATCRPGSRPRTSSGTTWAGRTWNPTASRCARCTTSCSTWARSRSSPASSGWSSASMPSLAIADRAVPWHPMVNRCSDRRTPRHCRRQSFSPGISGGCSSDLSGAGIERRTSKIAIHPNIGDGSGKAITRCISAPVVEQAATSARLAFARRPRAAADGALQSSAGTPTDRRYA